MRRLVSILAIGLFGIALHAQALTVTLTWPYDFTGIVKCGGAVTTNCISGFEIGLMNGTVMQSPQVVALPSGTGQTTNTGSFAVTSSFVVVGAVVTGKDSTGATIRSTPATTVGIKGIVNLTLTFQ